jgi:hypothetical protein
MVHESAFLPGKSWPPEVAMVVCPGLNMASPDEPSEKKLPNNTKPQKQVLGQL